MHVLLVDDHELVRDTIQSFLQREDDIKVSVACDLDGASALVRREGPYDLVMLDYSMPGMNGLDGLSKTRDMNLGKPVAILSGTATRAVAEAALAAGAAGFLPKTISAKSFIHAVRFMAAGEIYAPVQFLTQRETERPHPLASKLTSRELEVLAGLVDGRANKEIARSIGLREVTIKLHVKTLCRKLGARNRTHAAMIAKNLGIS